MRLRLKKKQKEMLFDIALMLFCYILGIVIGAYAWGRPEVKIAKTLPKYLTLPRPFAKPSLGQIAIMQAWPNFAGLRENAIIGLTALFPSEGGKNTKLSR